MKRLFTVIVVMMTVVLMACGNKVDNTAKATKEEMPMDFGSIKFYGIGLSAGYLGLDISSNSDIDNLKKCMDEIESLASSGGLEKAYNTHITIGDRIMSFDIQELNGTGDINVRINKSGDSTREYKLQSTNPLGKKLKDTLGNALSEYILSVEKIEKAYKDGFVLK